MSINEYTTVTQAKNSFEKILASPKYSEIIRDDKHLELLLKMTDINIVDNILDIGTGTGYLAFPLAKTHMENQIIGIDIAQNILEKNTAIAEQEHIKNLQFLSFDGINYPFNNTYFGLIVSRYAFHHFPNIEKSVAQIAHLLRPNGYLLISDPIRHEEDTKHIIDKFMAAKGDGHIQFYTIKELTTIFSKYGIIPEQTVTTTMNFPFPPKQEYIELYHTLTQKEKELYQISEKDGVIWIGTIDVGNILFRKT